MNMTRLFYLAVFIACLSLLSFGLYLEHVQNLEPCPLCIFQRIAYLMVSLIALAAAIHDPACWQRIIYSGLILITAGIGATVAGRQVWLQQLPPDQIPECGPGLEYMLEMFPLTDTLKKVFTGSGECAEVQWSFIGMSIAQWSLVFFSVIIVTTLAAMFIFKEKTS